MDRTASFAAEELAVNVALYNRFVAGRISQDRAESLITGDWETVSRVASLELAQEPEGDTAHPGDELYVQLLYSDNEGADDGPLADLE